MNTTMNKEIKSKILFVCDGYYPEKNAASYCAFRLITLLRKRNISCDVINVSATYDIPFIVEEEDGRVFSIRDDYRVDYSQTKGNPIRFFRYILFRFFGRINKCGLKRIKNSRILSLLKKIGGNYDVIIPVVSDFNNGMAVLKYSRKRHIPYIIYQLDPIGTNETQVQYSAKLKRFEIELYKKATYILTTPLLMKEKHLLSSFDNKKIISAEFPNVIDNYSYKEPSPTRIICAFCGNLINGVRNCKYVLNLFSRMNNSNVYMKFAGIGQEKTISEYANGALNGHIEQYGKLNKEEAIAFIQNADFLINIGNTMKNQVPSKLFDYVSTSIPIINVCSSSDCPSITYMKKYGMAINLVETEVEEEIDKQAVDLYMFINEHLGHRVSNVLDLFRENTPQYVESQLWKAIQDTVSGVEKNGRNTE